VEVAATYHAGSNLEARHARGMEGLTVRAMSVSPPPDEEWVVVGYRSLDGQPLELRAEWTLIGLPAEPDRAGPPPGEPAAAALGLDLEGDTVQRVHELLFAPHVRATKRRIEAARAGAMAAAAAAGAGTAAAEDLKAAAASAVQGLESTMPSVFTARVVQQDGRNFGHVRIRTFNVQSDVSFVDEFIRLIELPEMPKDGLIIDVRGNGGGLIWAGERLLQLLTPRRIEPCRLQFINTPLNLQLCRATPSLAPWAPSLERAVETGATFSAAFPITEPERCNDIGQRYYGPVVLVTDARCYSTTDFFAAGFKDHAIGPILGVDGNTGAGGANVWTFGLIRHFFSSAGLPPPLQPLPKGADMRVAIRRTLRVGPEAGTELEDLGVVPDERHAMTLSDVLEDNPDLVAHAARLLAGRQGCRFEVAAARDGGKLVLELRTQGVDRVDAYVGGRPRESRDVQDGAMRFELAESAPAQVELRGYTRGQLTCSRALSG
jgi:hypothetical protein